MGYKYFAISDGSTLLHLILPTDYRLLTTGFAILRRAIPGGFGVGAAFKGHAVTLANLVVAGAAGPVIDLASPVADDRLGGCRFFYCGWRWFIR